MLLYGAVDIFFFLDITFETIARLLMRWPSNKWLRNFVSSRESILLLSV